jgi:hypothetical protein
MESSNYPVWEYEAGIRTLFHYLMSSDYTKKLTQKIHENCKKILTHQTMKKVKRLEPTCHDLYHSGVLEIVSDEVLWGYGALADYEEISFVKVTEIREVIQLLSQESTNFPLQAEITMMTCKKVCAT